MKPNWKQCGVADCYRDHVCHNELSGRDCLVSTRRKAQQAFALRISESASYAELRVQRAFGEDWITAYGEAWRVMDEVYGLALAPDKPAVHLPDHMISKTSNRGF